ncbi:MAG: integration host factor, actinobacterial type [Actinomyces sp.]|uniref:integration host factor, actinobacterial type n=1 Tax=Actinomyces sp. TaxID=29317 RepID=UPI0026DBDA52|nr:integration host factor, actinobacterial type [Actinomyces sp.]MDO4243568.1 integration host factor, actinobacterial type [Actinomyces sp.]
MTDATPVVGEPVVPALTAGQRREGSRRAVAARARRARVRRDLKAGRVTLAEVLETAGDDPALERMRVRDLLLALPRVGPTTANRVLDETGIADSRRLRGLSERQRGELLARFG